MKPIHLVVPNFIIHPETRIYWHAKNNESVVAGQSICVFRSPESEFEFKATDQGFLQIIIPEGIPVGAGYVFAQLRIEKSSHRARTNTNSNPQDPSPRRDARHEFEFQGGTKHGIEKLIENDSGYIVGRLSDEVLRLRTDAHMLTTSPTGGGKTSGTIIPNLLDHPGSALVVDIRGETVQKTANAKRLQGHHVVVLDPYNITDGQWGIDRYNPLDRLLSKAEMIDSDDLIQRLVRALMFDPSGRMSNEPIWDNATKNLLSGLLSLCLRYWPSHRHNLLEIYDTLNLTKPDMDKLVDEIFLLIDSDDTGQEDRQLRSLLKILSEGRSTTKITDNALMQAQSVLHWIGNRSYRDMLGHSTFTFDNMQEQPMVVYLVVPEEHVETSAVWVRVMIESAIFSLDDIVRRYGIPTDKLPQKKRCLFLLDELPVFGKLDVISSGMATLRGRGINLWLFVQNLAQLDDIYGEHKARTILGNTALIQAFQTNELKELEYFCQVIGDEIHDVQSIAINESTTEGQSTAKGNSHTISNSESLTHTSGTADTITEAKGVTWSTSKGTSTQESTATGQSHARQRGTTSSHGGSDGSSKSNTRSGGSSKGKSKGKTRQRNYVSVNQGGESSNTGENNSTNKGWQKTKGTQQNSNWSNARNQSKTETDSFTYTQGKTRQETNTEGGSETYSKAHSTNQSTAHNRQSGTSDTSSRTFTENTSATSGRTVTVKPERMKIETVRTLREKMTGRNQLLVIRGSQPFFTPKMSHFVRYLDADQYMFPSFAVMTSFEVLNELAERPIFTDNYADVEALINHALSVSNSVRNIALRAQENRGRSGSLSNLEQYQQLIGSLRQTKEDLNRVSATIFARKKALDEVAIALETVFILMRENMAYEFWTQEIETMEEKMASIQPINTANLLPDSLIQSYLRLPIMSIKNGYQDGYNIQSEIGFLLNAYSKTILKVHTDVTSAYTGLRKALKDITEVRTWLTERIRYAHHYIYEALEVVMEKELERRREFFKSQHGMS